MLSHVQNYSQKDHHFQLYTLFSEIIPFSENAWGSKLGLSKITHVKTHTPGSNESPDIARVVVTYRKYLTSYKIHQTWLSLVYFYSINATFSISHTSTKQIDWYSWQQSPPFLTFHVWCRQIIRLTEIYHKLLEKYVEHFSTKSLHHTFISSFIRMPRVNASDNK